MNTELKIRCLNALSKGLPLIRYASAINSQYVYELADALHNMPDYIKTGKYPFIEENLSRAEKLLNQIERSRTPEKLVGRSGIKYELDKCGLDGYGQ